MKDEKEQLREEFMTWMAMGARSSGVIFEYFYPKIEAKDKEIKEQQLSASVNNSLLFRKSVETMLDRAIKAEAEAERLTALLSAAEEVIDAAKDKIGFFGADLSDYKLSLERYTSLRTNKETKG